MNLFASEVREKSMLARGARSRVIGTRSKRCKMSTDGMTQKEIAKLHGPVKTYRMVPGVSDTDLAEWPEDLRKEYIKRFR